MKARKHPAAVVLAAAAISLIAAGCGEITNTIAPRPGTANKLTVMLAGKPNGLYVGIYEAQALGYFAQTDLNVGIESPAAGQDPIQLVHNKRVMVAIGSEANVLLHRNRLQPVVGIAAIVHSPLSSIRVGRRGATNKTPSANSGSGVGTATTTTSRPATGGTAPTTATATTATATTTTATTTTAPPTTAARSATTRSTTSTVRTASGRALREPDLRLLPRRVRSLLSGPHVPTYDGLVIVVRDGTIIHDAPVLRRFVQAVARGYRAAQLDPRHAVRNMLRQVPALRHQAARQLAIVQAAMPYFFPPGLPRWGYQRDTQWNAFGQWLESHHVLTYGNAITGASTNELLQGLGV
ncbi:MAG: ABC transporter substrate-binding protein [Solirubrobacteraceae bacterium]